MLKKSAAPSSTSTFSGIASTRASHVFLAWAYRAGSAYERPRLFRPSNGFACASAALAVVSRTVTKPNNRRRIKPPRCRGLPGRHQPLQFVDPIEDDVQFVSHS